MEQDFGKILAAWMSGIWIFMGNFKGRRILQFLQHCSCAWRAFSKHARQVVSARWAVSWSFWTFTPQTVMIALIAEFDPAKARAIWMGLSTDGARRLED